MLGMNRRMPTAPENQPAGQAMLCEDDFDNFVRPPHMNPIPSPVGDITFEATASFCYRFSRYVVLPEVALMPEVTGGEKFLLRELVFRVIDKYLTPEEQSQYIPYKESDGGTNVRRNTRYYAGFLASENHYFENLGKGWFQQIDVSAVPSQSEVLDAADEEDEETGESDMTGGWIYAFSFPLIVKSEGAFPIKIGKTIGTVETRVADQCKGSAIFQAPVVLGKWKVQKIGELERAVHAVLKAKSKWIEPSGGTGVEWFNTTIAEVEAILKFVQS
jgi:T5orf172 domain